jgi:hypothetical protein
MENVKHLVVTTPITNTLKFEDDGVRRNEAMKVKDEVPPQDEEDDVKMEKKEEESPSHEGEDDEKGKEKMLVKAEAPPQEEKNKNQVPQEEADEEADEVDSEDEKLAWFQPFIAEAMGYPERATHFARHYDDWDYFDA